MATAAERASRTRDRVVDRACNYCRKRKIRCDGNHPCKNCHNRNKECIYEPKRSNNASILSQQTINALENELAEHKSFVDLLKISSATERDYLLRERANATNLLSLQTPGSNESIPDAQRTYEKRNDEENPMVYVENSSTSVGHLHVGIDGQVKFHGPTSAFSDSPHYFDKSSNTNTFPQTPHLSEVQNERFSNAETILSEAAAEARQAEMIDLAAGRLDFDGVKPELGMHLLGIHWARQHHALLLTYRPSFMRDMAVPGGGKYFSKLLLNSIYFGASKFSTHTELRADPDDPRTAGFVFLKRVRELLGNAVGRSKITTVQALLLLASSLFALGDQQTSWLYSGLAFRMIIDLGLHIDNAAFDTSLSLEDIEIRRRVFYGAFCFDKIHSLYQGRPCALQGVETRVPLVFWDIHEENELWRPFPRPFGADSKETRYHPGVPMYSVTTFQAMCKLCFILNRVHNELYGLQRPRKPVHVLKSLDSEIKRWAEELPPHLQFDPNNREKPCPSANVFALHCMHATLIILLHRPFVSHGHLRELIEGATEDSWQRCREAADRLSDIFRLYGEELSWKRSPFFISYCGYIAATIHVRVAAQHGKHSNAAKRLKQYFDACTATETINTGVTRPKQVILSLMNSLGVSHDEEGSSNSSPPNGTIQQSPEAQSSKPETQEVDMNALIRSFMAEQTNNSGNAPMAPVSSEEGIDQIIFDATASRQAGSDPLFGLMGDWDLSPFETLLRTHDL